MSLHWSGLYASAKTRLIFLGRTKNEAIIVYGIEGYPPLPTSYFWRKDVIIPDSGLLITSSLIEDLPGYHRDYFDGKANPIQMNNLFVQDVCLDTTILIVAQYFTPKMYYPYIPFDQNDLQRDYKPYMTKFALGKLEVNMWTLGSKSTGSKNREIFY